jgi:hypothetical protein
VSDRASARWNPRAYGWRVLLVLALAAAFFAAGVFFGSQRRPEPAASNAPGTASSVPQQTADMPAPREIIARLWTAAREPRSVWRTLELLESIQHLDRAQLREALETTRKLNTASADTVIRLLMNRWHEIDPAGLAAWAGPQFRVGASHLAGWSNRVAMAWSKVAPADAMRASVNGQGTYTEAILNFGWSDKNWSAIARGERIVLPEDMPSRARDRVWFGTVLAVDDEDPRLAREYAREIRDPYLRVEALQSIVEAQIGKDPEAALAAAKKDWAATAPGPGLQTFIAQTFEALGRRDARAALAEAAMLPADWSRVAKDAALIGWMGSDLRAALMWAYEHGEVTQPHWEHGPMWDREVITLMRKATSTDEDTAIVLEWLRTLPQGPERMTLVAQAFDRIDEPGWFAELSPEWKLEWAYRFGREVQAREDVALSTDWLSQVPAGEARLRAIDGWASTGRPLEADAKLESFFPTGPDRDALLLGTIAHLRSEAREKPEVFGQMTELAGQMTTPEVRERALRRVANFWIARDEPAAVRWMQESSGLPPATQQMILRRSRGKQPGPK